VLDRGKEWNIYNAVVYQRSLGTERVKGGKSILISSPYIFDILNKILTNF